VFRGSGVAPVGPNGGWPGLARPVRADPFAEYGIASSDRRAAAANSEQLPNRSAGRLAIASVNTASSPGGTSGR
jgi:hypothetical protein